MSYCRQLIVHRALVIRNLVRMFWVNMKYITALHPWGKEKFIDGKILRTALQVPYIRQTVQSYRSCTTNYKYVEMTNLWTITVVRFCVPNLICTVQGVVYAAALFVEFFFGWEAAAKCHCASAAATYSARHTFFRRKEISLLLLTLCRKNSSFLLGCEDTIHHRAIKNCFAKEK